MDDGTAKGGGLDPGAALLFGALLGLVVGASWGVSRICSDFNEWPGWIQAIGSLIGIATAIYVPWRQRQLERADELRDRHLQAQAVGILVVHDLRVLQGTLERALPQRALEHLSVGPPRSLEDSVGEFWKMGEVGGLLTLLLGVLRANRDLLVPLEGAPPGIEFDYMEAVRLSQDRIRSAIALCIEAVRGIDAMLDVGAPE